MRIFLAGLAAGAVAVCAGYALASRNSSGTMSAANGPYIAGTTISSSIINSRYADIEAEITDSLSRSGKGGMTAALKGTDGTVAAPAFSFTSEPGTGWYRIGVGNPGLSVLGTKRLECTSTGCVVTGTLGVTGHFTNAATFDSTLGVTGAATFSGALTATGAGQNAASFNTSGSMLGSILLQDTNNGVGSGGAVVFAGNNVNAFAEIKGLLTSGLNNTTGDLTIGTRRVSTDGTLTEAVRIAASGAVTMAAGATIGASGTAISGSFRGTASWTPGVIAAGSVATTNVTITGAVAGADCVVTAPGAGMTLSLTCAAGTNLCAVYLGNPGAAGVTGNSGTYACRVFNP